MRTRVRSLPLVVLALVAASSMAVPAALAEGHTDDVAGRMPAVGFDYSDWNSVVSRFVDERGLVDYDALAKDRAALDRYLAAIRTQGPESTPELFPARDDRLAYYINGYNALVFEGVLSRGPEKKSVWRGLISGYSFFVRMKVRIDGARTNLKTLEDETIRAGFKDPRVHAALNCASLGCPRLPRRVFLAETLDEQLDAGMREFVAEVRNVRVHASTRRVELSKIFDWFEEDFIGWLRGRGDEDPRILDFVNAYRAADAQIPRDYRVGYMAYDKAINAQRH